MSGQEFSRRHFFQLGAGLTISSIGSLQSLGLSMNTVESSERSSSSNQTCTKWNSLPQWRGFNLCEKFSGKGAPFREADFQNISDLGFNFVRLPMDYRMWIVDGDKCKFNEKTLDEIDKAIEYGQKYGIHINVNFHRAPGYCVNPPQEEQSIWDNEEILDVCKLHWQTFAKRYHGISSDTLSFNLFNEPAGCTEEKYYYVVKSIVNEIRQVDANRLIICDGLDWGTKPCLSFKNLEVAQSTRGYSPMEISHYGASWVNGQNFPEPHWPMTSFNSLVPSKNKRELSEEIRKPLTLTGNFSNISELRFTIGVVSGSAELLIKIDNNEAFRRRFVCSEGKGEWKEVHYVEEYDIYANVYELELKLPIPPKANTIEIMVVDGDWLSISKLKLVTNQDEEIVALGSADWHAQKQTRLKYERNETGTDTITGGLIKNRHWLFENNVKPWLEAQNAGIGVMVGEFGCYNKTPHHITLSWLEDTLTNWKKVGWGWALWNFRGAFGVADSGRSDVDYQSWRGLQLDRKMLELLQRY